MSTFSSMNQDICKRMRVLDQKQRLAHAYLFIGAKYGGKSETAIAVAKMLNCERSTECADDSFFCDTCPSCVKMNSASHPDMLLIEGEPNDTIKIDQVRQLNASMRLRAFSARKKIFIIKNIDRMTAEASNAFLKTLEEPNSDCLIILTTSQLENVMGTIVSRCHVMRFALHASGDLKKQLMDAHGLDAGQAHFLAYYAQGCMGRAEKYLQDSIWDFRQEVIDRFLLAPDYDAFIKEISSDKARLRDTLDILISWLRDCLFIKCGIDQEQWMHQDCSVALKNFADKHSYQQLQEIYITIIDAYKMLKENFNIKIPLALVKNSFA